MKLFTNYPDFDKQMADKFRKDITIKRILDLKASILKNSIPTLIVDKETKEVVRVLWYQVRYATAILMN